MKEGQLERIPNASQFAFETIALTRKHVIECTAEVNKSERILGFEAGPVGFEPTILG